MKPFLFLLVAVFFFNWKLFSQNRTESYDITIPDTVISGSLYSTLRLIDIRRDTLSTGIIQKGAFNKRVKIVAETPLRTQFSELMRYVTGNSFLRDRELLLVLREFNFAEVTGALSEKGYFQLRADFFEEDNGMYKKLSGIDTVVVVSALDVTKKMLAKGSRIFSDFLISGLKKTSIEKKEISLSQAKNIDSIEKSVLPLYTAKMIKNGAYKDFSSFLNQVPDDTTLKMEFSKKGALKSILIKRKNGKYNDAELDKWYVFAFNDKLIISTGYGIYPLEKKGNDFFFTGKAFVAAKSEDVMLASMFFGILGGLAASGGSTAESYMKIDHKGGGFIRIKEASGK